MSKLERFALISVILLDIAVLITLYIQIKEFIL